MRPDDDNQTTFFLAMYSLNSFKCYAHGAHSPADGTRPKQYFAYSHLYSQSTFKPLRCYLS